MRPGAAGPYDVGSVGLLAGLPLRNYRADFDLSPTAEGTEVRWHSRFDAPAGFGWIYVAALRRFTRRLLDGLAKMVQGMNVTG